MASVEKIPAKTAGVCGSLISLPSFSLAEGFNRGAIFQTWNCTVVNSWDILEGNSPLYLSLCLRHKLRLHCSVATKQCKIPFHSFFFLFRACILLKKVMSPD